MSEPFPAQGEQKPAPEQIIQSILEQGRASKRGPIAYVDAISFARRHSWKDIENDLYSQLGLSLVKTRQPLDEAAADLLAGEVSAPHFDEVAPTALRTLLAAVTRATPGSPALLRLVTAFESRTEAQGVSWHARLMMGGLINSLFPLDPALAVQVRRRLTKRVADWTIEYHITPKGDKDTDLRTRASFRSLFSSAWGDTAPENVANGLDGAFHCALERMTQETEAEWFVPYLIELTPEIAGAAMHRKLSRETLFRIGEMLGSARRAVYARHVASALALTTLEEAIHRPHRRQIDPAKAGVKLELELPGPRGFGRGIRLPVFDISRDGCLAVTQGPARFEESSASVTELHRAAGRTFNVRRLAGTLRQGSAEWDVRPETALILHDAGRSTEWAAIDGASVVRVADDRASGRLWLGFHFDRVIPAVQREIETFVYGAA